jgi:hydroxyacylglutathione hydrolase
MFQRFHEEGLSQSSYLIACARTREAAVVDPRRDVDEYVAVARDRGLSIVWTIDTHIHADFVSGARELAAVGARHLAGPGAGLLFEHHEVAHRECLRLGDVTLSFLHTPGHTPEHVSVLVDEPRAPRRVLTGDTLFVGAVGRPDLLGAEETQRLAGELYETLHAILLALDDDVEVHPGHGAGSLCGAGIAAAPHSTIGHERRFSPLLAPRSKKDFVAEVLADLPETPPYFPRMKRLNQEGAPVCGLVEPPAPLQALSPAEARRLVDGGALVVDLRSAASFARLHPAGALHLEYGPKVGAWAGWLVPASARLVLVADDTEEAADARAQLLRIGIDGVAGHVSGGFDGWVEAGLPVSGIDRLDVRALLTREEHGDRLTVLDVRSRREFESGHLDGAVHLPLNELVGRAPGLPAGRVATICETGYRSSLAASVLARHGVRSVASVAGGMAELETTPAHR